MRQVMLYTTVSEKYPVSVNIVTTFRGESEFGIEMRFKNYDEGHAYAVKLADANGASLVNLILNRVTNFNK